MEAYFNHHGFCPVCAKDVDFSSVFAWYRDHLFCKKCGSLPRERALMQVLNDYFPDLKDRSVFEMALEKRAFSLRLSSYIKNHSFALFDAEKEYQPSDNRNEKNVVLEQLDIDDNSVDIVITHDLMNHVLKPRLALKEIARVLKPGGAHIFTVPLVNKTNSTVRRAERLSSGKIKHQQEAQYWGSATKPDGPLVTMDWGYDIGNFILTATQMPTTLMNIVDKDKAILGEMNEVVVSFKNG